MNPVEHPSMTKVREMLEGEVEILQLPPDPFQLPQNLIRAVRNAENHHLGAVWLLAYRLIRKPAKALWLGQERQRPLHLWLFIHSGSSAS
ncbi:hypothetical protein RJ640_023214 [Escallonia rubra]|uniref:Uncharacterized protein n=1 Tax=Escallonia rubra TaxID=112253 RepID=A0AA88S7K9_9ASTE|nr:hypothetical protein RJ640_023214 [Escallonia rubra]